MGDTITQAMASDCITNITSNSYPNTAGTALFSNNLASSAPTPPQSTKRKEQEQPSPYRGWHMRCDED
jgi:hypothetical protein